MLDFVCLPLEDCGECLICPVDSTPGKLEYVNRKEEIGPNHFSLDNESRLKLEVSDHISIIGFSFGAFTNPVLPLWTVGYVSGEPDLPDIFGVIFVDCRARKGQSGAPVYAKRNRSHRTIAGDDIMYDGDTYRFIGLYSGRINADSDIGQIWNAESLFITASSVTSGRRAEVPTDRKLGGPISRVIS